MKAKPEDKRIPFKTKMGSIDGMMVYKHKFIPYNALWEAISEKTININIRNRLSTPTNIKENLFTFTVIKILFYAYFLLLLY